MARLIDINRLQRFKTKIMALLANYFPITGGTITGNVVIKRPTSPVLRLTVDNVAGETRVYKNASASADFGTTIADYDNDGARDSLVLCRENALAQKLCLSVENDDGTRSVYYLYGPHNKPTPADLGAFPVTGGTINGDTNVAGVLRVQGQQAYYYATGTKSQTLGTNNATGGTTVCCGPDADMILNGKNQRTKNVLPQSNGAYPLGDATYRWKGIYSTVALNVSSDARMKRDIAYVNDAGKDRLAGLVRGLHVALYNYKDDPLDADTRIGLIAQDIQGVDPQLAKLFVHEDAGGMLSIRPADLVFPLIATVQQLSARVEELEAKNKE